MSMCWLGRPWNERTKEAYRRHLGDGNHGIASLNAYLKATYICPPDQPERWFRALSSEWFKRGDPIP